MFRRGAPMAGSFGGRRDMAEDWKPGDLALCIKIGDWIHVKSRKIGKGPRAGNVLRVRNVVSRGGVTWLFLDGWPGNKIYDAFAARRFCKINPHTPDAEDEETIRLLNGVNAYRGVS